MTKRTTQGVLPVTVPLSIFDARLSPLESITKYLKENHGLKYSAIGTLLGRDQRMARITYLRAAKKVPGKIGRKRSGEGFPLALLADRSLSPAEHLTAYLRERGMRYCAIAELLGCDDRTVWTFARRAAEKRADA
jgi:hypothetical protein